MVSEVKWRLRMVEPLLTEEEEKGERNYLYLQKKWLKDSFRLISNNTLKVLTIVSTFFLLYAE